MSENICLLIGKKTQNNKNYLKFLDLLSEKMNLDSIAVEIGFDMRLDAVLARAEQLIKLERGTLTDNKIMVRNLQRKVKAQKEQLENKELHMKLLRQKIIQLEEEKQIKALEQDKTIEELSKLQEKLEKMKTKAEKQLTSVKCELHVTERAAKEDKEKAKHLLESLADFRTVISRLLGLNIATVALPDYEIVTRLEGLIHSHQHHCSPCACFKCQ
ncbi:hypothetical protein Chor_006597 [Crotalus horridus]